MQNKGIKSNTVPKTILGLNFTGDQKGAAVYFETASRLCTIFLVHIQGIFALALHTRLCHWLKKSRYYLNQSEGKSKPSRFSRILFPAFGPGRLYAIPSSYDWFIGLSVFAVIAKVIILVFAQKRFFLEPSSVNGARSRPKNTTGLAGFLINYFLFVNYIFAPKHFSFGVLNTTPFFKRFDN